MVAYGAVNHGCRGAPVAALASGVDVAVVDVTVPTTAVTLAPGASGSITITLTVSGNQAGAATFKVYRDWTLSGGTFAGSNPQTFTVSPRASGDPATIFATSGTVSVAAAQAPGTFTLAVSAVDITNSNQTGAKLGAGAPSAYAVTVSSPPAPSDTTPPSIAYALSPASPDGDNSWYRSDVRLIWTVTEADSPGSLVRTGCVDQAVTSDQAATEYTCSATSDGGFAGPVSVSIKRDATAPGASASAAPAPNANGWNRTDVTVSFSGTDSLSGIAACTADAVLGEGAGQSASGTCSDNAGNVSAPATASGINVDKTDPSVSMVAGPAGGGTYHFGFVPAAPSCVASDALSGIDGTCSVTGYSGAVGTHTVTAVATDRAGNEASTSVTYTVLAWTLRGFFAPVDMGSVLNTVKGGSTVPLKFTVFAGSTELTSTSVVTSFTSRTVACEAFTGDPTAAVEFTTTGGTSLRYDGTGGQFVQNWQTPKGAGTCYQATLTTQDGSRLVAYFQTK